MEVKTVSEINRYAGTSVHPLEHPEQMYELYSVPSFETGHPEVIKGKEIGSTKITVEEGDVLICKINPRINRVWVVKHNTEYPLLASSEWIVIRNNEIDSNYLKWYFSSPSFRMLLNSQVAGIGGSLTRAQPKQVAKYPIPVPNAIEQQKTSKVLDELDRLIALRKEQLINLDELVKSRFIEMFGDPETNPKGLKKVLLSDIAEYYNGLTYSPDNVSQSGTVVLRSSNIQKSQLDFSDTVRVDCAIKEKLFVKDNDILMCSRNGSAKLVGKVALIKNLTEPMSFGAFMMIIRSRYYPYLMTYFQMDAFRRQIATGATTTINQITGNMLNKISLPLPERSGVNRFAAFVEQTDKLKLAIQQSLDKLELLKKSLMQEYFG